MKAFNDIIVRNSLLASAFIGYTRLSVNAREQFYNAKSMLQYGKTDMFNNVAIETTTECTRRCSYCPESLDFKKRFVMGENLVKSILLQLKEIDYKGDICFNNYGEPLLDKRLESFVSIARRYFPKANIFIATNGDLLTVKRFRSLAKAGMNKFFITQQGNPIPKNHILLKESLTDEEKKLVGWYYLDENSLLQNRGGYIKLKSKRIPKKICNLNTLIIKADGIVCACCQDYFHDINIGDAKAAKIMDIWYSPTFKSLRKNLMRGITERDICKKCYLFTG